MPREYVEKIHDKITDVNITHSQKIDRIRTVLEKKRVTALLAQSDLDQMKKTGPQMTSNVNSMVGDHDCSKSRECQRKWGKLGCVELYKFSSAKERKAYLFSCIPIEPLSYCSRSTSRHRRTCGGAKWSLSEHRVSDHPESHRNNVWRLGKL